MSQPLTLAGHVPLPAHTGNGGFDHAAVHAGSGHVELPAHTGNGGFDHAAVHAATGHVYVAHTANSAIDVFDPVAKKHLHSVPDLAAVAGALVSDDSQLVFTSNLGDNTIGVFAPGPDPKVTKTR